MDSDPNLLPICDWEKNGYDDSDFYGAWWDRLNKRVITEEIGTTRYAAPGRRISPEKYGEWTLEDVREFRERFENFIFVQLRIAEDRDVLEPQPQDVKIGEKLLVSQPKKCLKFSPIEQGNCPKCDGTGNWVNPRNSQDVRKCFACDGKGVGRTIGKPISFARSYTLAENTAVILEWVGTFQTVFEKGYNKYDRFSATTRVSFIDPELGEIVVFVPMNHLRLAQEPLSDEELRRRAHELSYNFVVGSFVGCTTWLSAEYIPHKLIEEVKNDLQLASINL